MDSPNQISLKEEYDSLAEKAQEQLPGIFDLISVYQAQQASLQQSQEYLQLFQQTFISSTSNSTY